MTSSSNQQTSNPTTVQNYTVMGVEYDGTTGQPVSGQNLDEAGEMSEEDKEFEKRLLSSFILIPIAIFFIIQGSIFFIFFLGFEKQIVLVTSVVPYLYCPPESHKKISFLLIFFVFFFVAL